MQMRYNAGEIITAMVTPMDEKREIDFLGLERVIEHLIANCSDSVIVAGTTGESPTLTHEEEVELFKFTKSKVKNRIKVIMGAGSNSTLTAVTMSKKAQQLGADAILSVVPYYNKPSQAGMYEHFSNVAKAVDIPIILYNIPGRTGVNMQPETIAKLAKDFPNIVAVKQSFPDLDLISEIRMLCPEDFAIYSGDDSLTLPMLAMGAQGVVSVASHVVGNELNAIIKNFKNGEINAPKNMHLKLFPLFKKLFMCPNPVPVKEALTQMGLIQNYVRRPLVEMNDTERKQFTEILKEYI